MFKALCSVVVGVVVARIAIKMVSAAADALA